MYTVQGRPFADIIGNDPQIEPTRMGDVFADAADPHCILSRGVNNGSWIATILVFVEHLNARRFRQQRTRVGALIFTRVSMCTAEWP